MAGERGIDRPALAREALVIDAGAAAGPALAAAAEQGGGDGGGGGRVADAHFAETDEVRVGRDRGIAGGDGGEECRFVHGRLLREVRGGGFERERDDRRVCPRERGELIDGGAAGGEIRHHLRGDPGGIGRHALRDHAVVAGEDEDLDAIEPRQRPALPAGKPHHQRPPAVRGCPAAW